MEFKEKCLAKVKHPKIVCADSGTKRQSKMTFLNAKRKEILKIHVDGCQITDNNTLKCDFLVIREEERLECYVELKGQDVMHAVEQIENTIKLLSKDEKKQLKYAFVIFSSRNPKTSAQLQNIKKKFKKSYNCKLIFQKKQGEFAL
ncbi:MAG: hypothetical protein ACPG5B_11895 [Chitinophagales bacterium]